MWMISKADFSKKQIVMVFTLEGEKVSFRNDNLLVTDSDGVVKVQTTCYRIFALMIVGHTTITTGIISGAHKFGFPIYLMTPSFRTYDIIGHRTEGHVSLREIQYSYEGLDLGKHLVRNKISNQMAVLRKQRTNDWALRECLDKMQSILEKSILRRHWMD